ncbi:MAG: DUF3352 domain-containing protein [Cyanobacteria bacterium P01_H01_bin.162]
MKSRTFYSAIALVAGLLVLVGAAGFWGLTSQNPRALLTQGGQTVPTAAQFVPRQAPMMAALLARPDRVWQLRQLLTPANRRFVARQEWQALKQSLETTVGWAYDADVRPWLGSEVTFAVTTPDLDHDETNGLQAGYLALLSCRDVEAAREALHVLWQQRAAQGRKLIFETVSGIPLIYDQAPNRASSKGLRSAKAETVGLEALTSALVGDRYVLLANDPRVLRQAIATYQAPDVSLARAANYRTAIATLPPQRIGWVYANGPRLLAWLGKADQAESSLADAGEPTANFLFLSLRAFSEGLLGDTAIAAAPGQTFAVNQPHSAALTTALDLLPENTLFATTGSDLTQRVAASHRSLGGVSVAQRSFRALLESLSLSPDSASTELLPALPGDYTMGLLPGTTPTWLFLTPLAERQSWSAVDEFAKTQGINVSQVPLGDRTLTTWTRVGVTRSNAQSPLSITTQVVGVHTVVQGHQVLATSLAGLEQVLQSVTTPSLVAQPAFGQLTEQFDQPGQALTYVNWPALAPTLIDQFPWLQAIAAAGQPLTGHIGAITISDYGSSESLQQGSVAIRLVEDP